MTLLPTVPNDVLARQRRHFWNRYSVLAGALWFGASSALGWMVLTIRYAASAADVFPIILTLVGCNALSGGLVAAKIGNAARSWFQLAKAVALATAAAFLGLFVAGIFLSSSSPIDLGDSVWAFLYQRLRDCLSASSFAGWYFYPPAIIAGLHLYWIRSAVPPWPKVLGCGQVEHGAQIAAKEGAP